MRSAMYAARENTMDAAESKLSISDTAMKRIEGGLRAPLRSNSPANAAGACDDMLAARAMSIAEIVGDRARGSRSPTHRAQPKSNASHSLCEREKTMDAAESELSISDTATKTIEGGIRALVLGNRPTSAVEPCDDILAAGATAIADIEKLMEELQTARDYLQAEGERVRQVTVRYAHLAQTASASAKIIADSIGKWHNLETDTASESHTAMIEAPAPKLVPDGEPEPKEPSPELSNTTQGPQARCIAEAKQHGATSPTG
jgi:hypothetical protein